MTAKRADGTIAPVINFTNGRCDWPVLGTPTHPDGTRGEAGSSTFKGEASDERTAYADFNTRSRRGAGLPAPLADRFAEWLQRGTELGYVRPLNARIAAGALVHLIEESLEQLLEDESGDQSLEDLATEISRFELFGIVDTGQRNKFELTTVSSAGNSE